MWPSTYHSPDSLAELHGLLSTYGADARMFVGGTDVIVRLRHGAMKPAALIDLKRVRELSAQPERRGDSIRIGARVTISVRRIKIAMASGCPAAANWGRAALRLNAAASARGSPA